MSKTQNITISNQSSKIFISNTRSESAYEDDLKKKNDANNKNKTTTSTSSSITIFTPNIQIKINSFNEKENNELKNQSEMTPEHGKHLKKENFMVDEDVLLEGNDGKFYLGTIVNADKSGDYLIRFDDNTEKWTSHSNLKKFSGSPTKNDGGDDLSLCVICKVPNQYDVVEVCDKCSRGYHRLCIKQHNSSPSPKWNCTRCSFDVISISDSEELESVSAIEEITATEPVQEKVTKFSYDLKALKWDANHRTNTKNIYCYCGLNGVWKEKMLQCCACRQWFHEKCITSWKGYLLHGDTYFIFCCAVCNDGTEFLRRLHMKWSEIIHLIFYDLTIVRLEKYHSISKDVVPFILENMDKLNLPPDVSKMNKKELLEKKILQIVKASEEYKSFARNKKTTLYGLAKKLPPFHKHFNKLTNIPNGKFSEDLLKKKNIKYFEPSEIEKESFTLPSTSKMGNNDTMNQKNVDVDICDSSDETSSKSTLDLIIPPPKNFKGFNNPFHANYKTDISKIPSEKFLKKNAMKFPEVRIVRTFKRRLSAKDILLGPNQDAKRRKLTKRRKSSDIEVISEVYQPINFPLPQNLSYRNDSNGTSSFRNSLVSLHKNPLLSAAFEGRKSQSKNENKSSSNGQSTSAAAIKNDTINLNYDKVMNSPVKNNSINLYFGAMNRIENGERFKILAKRITFEGKEQYLLEWDKKSES